MPGEVYMADEEFDSSSCSSSVNSDNFEDLLESR